MKKLLIAIILALATYAQAGGPLQVTYTPVYPTDASPVVWSSMPIHYRVDAGPFSSLYSNAQGVQRVQAAFDVWHNVTTANVSFTNDGSLASDVNTVTGYNTAIGNCQKNGASAVIFDADGAISAALGYGTNVLAFAGICKVDSNGHAVGGFALLNGKWQNGVNTQTDPEIPQAEYNEAITHEFGHFLGLDHSQINQQILSEWYPNCNVDDLAGVPLMFPILNCQARSAAGLPMLSMDDKAWISRLYPGPTFSSSYGFITGYIMFPDGITPVQGINVIARQVDDPATTANENLRNAVSSVSGYLFAGNPGQSLTAKYLPCNVSASGCPSSGFYDDNSGGYGTGSRNPALIGYYEIPVPPGTYTVQIENIRSDFTAGSSVGPLDPPIGTAAPYEFWNEGESSTDNPDAQDTITVAPGETKKNINIILNNIYAPRFDNYEGPGATLKFPDFPAFDNQEVTLG